MDVPGREETILELSHVLFIMLTLQALTTVYSLIVTEIHLHLCTILL